MLDQFNRKISYLRISVTDRCDLRCIYCMPSEGITWLDHSKMLSFEEIIDVVEVAVELGIEKIRLTGGEPLVRKGIANLVKMIAETKGVKDLAMTTNGQQLEKYAEELYKAGLNRVNVSLDTLNSEKYSMLTRGGDIGKVFAGLEAAYHTGLSPIKINCVLNEQTTEEDKLELSSFCKEKDYKLRFIHQMSLTTGSFYPVEGGDGGQCSICNRIRLTAQGDVKPCLFSSYGYNVREWEAKNAIHRAIGRKPEKGQKNLVNEFYNIGG
ncbi:MAG: radical SAM protein [Bacteroidetes bacterium]|nr:radical SAM protein [Bacteroidota bacterium]|tara:strand:+ start:5067 stop:5867 length:801 start_codon:yes stop_codon:yes gene_type:complete